MKLKKCRFTLCILMGIGISLMLVPGSNQVKNTVSAKEPPTELVNSLPEFEKSLQEHTTGELISEVQVYFKMETKDTKEQNNDGTNKGYTEEEYEKELKNQ